MSGWRRGGVGGGGCLPLLVFSLMVIISSSEGFFLILCAFRGQPDKLWAAAGGGGGGGVTKGQFLKKLLRGRNVTKLQRQHGERELRARVESGGGVVFRDEMADVWRAHLLWVANTLLACPRPLQPGKGQWGSSCLLAFQAKGSPLMDDSFCLLAASGQLPALRWDVYFPDIWPCPSHPITGHLPEKPIHVVNHRWLTQRKCN